MKEYRELLEVIDKVAPNLSGMQHGELLDAIEVYVKAEKEKVLDNLFNN